MDKQEFRALAEEVARHLRRLRGEDWNVVVEYDYPAARRHPGAELAAAVGGGRLKLSYGSRVPGKVTVTGMFPQGYGHGDWRANVSLGRRELVIAQETDRRVLKAGYLAELAEVYKHKAADDALASRQDAWLATAAALFGREAPRRSRAGALRLGLDDYVASCGHVEPYDTPDGGRWSISLSGVPAEPLLRMLAVLAQDCAGRPAAAACQCCVDSGCACPGGQLAWPAVAADPARIPAGQCEFCRAPGVLLVAVLAADPDQRVCAECHADPRLPTLPAPAAGVPGGRYATAKRGRHRYGTAGELRAIRAYWARLAPAAAALGELGFADHAAEVTVIAKVIGAARFAVPLPCLICHRPEPVDVAIGDPHKAEPGAVLCGSCSAEIDARVAAVTAAPGAPP